MTWSFFWLFFAMMLSGAFVFAVGVCYGMFMMSVAYSHDEEEDEDVRYMP